MRLTLLRSFSWMLILAFVFSACGTRQEVNHPLGSDLPPSGTPKVATAEAPLGGSLTPSGTPTIATVEVPLGGDLPLSSAPRVASAEEAQSATWVDANTIEGLAPETYSADEYHQPGVLTFTISIKSSQVLMWDYTWCAGNAATLKQYWASVSSLQFVLDGERVPLGDFVFYETHDVRSCRSFYTYLSDWPAGEHHLSTTVTLSSAVNDVTFSSTILEDPAEFFPVDYPAGDYIFETTVYVKP